MYNLTLQIMKNLENYGVQELNETELSEINGGLDIGAAIELINGILNIVMGYMNAAVEAVADYVNGFLGNE